MSRPAFDPPNPRHYIKAYLSGQSEQSLAQEVGVGRGAIRTFLIKHGVQPRDRSAALTTRMANATPDERQAWSAAAHKAVRGKKRTVTELTKRAATKERSTHWIGRWEQELADELIRRRLPIATQKAVGPYNIDIALGHLAVEVHSNGSHPHTRDGQRIVYLTNRQWLVVYVHTYGGVNIPVVADYLCALHEETQRNPTLIGEYRVVRGSGEILPFSRRDLDHRP